MNRIARLSALGASAGGCIALLSALCYGLYSNYPFFTTLNIQYKQGHYFSEHTQALLAHALTLTNVRENNPAQLLSLYRDQLPAVDALEYRLQPSGTVIITPISSTPLVRCLVNDREFCLTSKQTLISALYCTSAQLTRLPQIIIAQPELLDHHTPALYRWFTQHPELATSYRAYWHDPKDIVLLSGQKIMHVTDSYSPERIKKYDALAHQILQEHPSYKGLWHCDLRFNNQIIIKRGSLKELV